MGTDTLDGGFDAGRLREIWDRVSQQDTRHNRANAARAFIDHVPALLSALESKDAALERAEAALVSTIPLLSGSIQRDLCEGALTALRAARGK